MLSFIALLLGSVAPFSSCDNLACSCISTADPQPTLQASAAVFVGRVISVTGTAADSGSESPDGLPVFMDSVTVVVEQTWKGGQLDTVRAGIDLTGPDCPTRFVPGLRYLIYTEMRNGRHIIGTCTRTSQLDSKLAQNDLQTLGRPTRTRK